jgi:predicted nucleic acid-binding protein
MSRPTYVVDTSVFMADAQPEEPHHGEAAALLGRALQEQWLILAPVIVLAEVAASIARNTGNPLLARLFISSLTSHAHIRIVEVDQLLGALAADIAAQHRSRGCDAIYIALAQVMNATLITLDKEQRGRVPSSVTARSPAEELALLPPLAP